MRITIAPNGSTPISEQIRSQVAESIVSLELREGDSLTPAAELAEQLVASPAAVLKAYRELEVEGFCRQGEQGFEVAPATLERQRERARTQRVIGGREALLEDLELARRIQVRLMPPALTESDRYAIAARVEAVELVSGDFYDVLHRGDEGVDVVVADVSGKGVGASLIMASVKARLPLLPPRLSPAGALRRLNAQLCADLGPRQFVAMAFARLHAGSGRLEVANAGLPYPYLVRRDGSVEAVHGEGPSLPLGVRPEVPYRAIEAALGSGERLLFCSDGLPEAPTADGQPLGYSELLAVLKEHASASLGSSGGPPASLRVWLDELLARLAEVAEGLPTDDQTALVLERRG